MKNLFNLYSNINFYEPFTSLKYLFTEKVIHNGFEEFSLLLSL